MVKLMTQQVQETTAATAAANQKDDVLLEVKDIKTYFHIGKNRVINTHTAQYHNGQNKRKDKIKRRSCSQYGNSCQNSFIAESTFITAVLILSHHHTGTAKGKRLQ